MSSVLGLPGWPHEAEEIMIARDVILAQGIGARLHVPHVTTKGAVELIRLAKQRGVQVTAEVTPHHLTLDDSVVATYDPVYKVNPPVRTVEDVAALRAALADGTIDAVATDHAPHPVEQKDQEWDHAPCGMLGLETAFALVLTELVLPRPAVRCSTRWPGSRRGPAAVRDLSRPRRAASPPATTPTWSWSTRTPSGPCTGTGYGPGRATPRSRAAS